MSDVRKIWSVEETLSLIEAYRGNPNLWDPVHMDHKNKTKKNDSLKEMAILFETSILEIDRKIKNMITQYQREERAVANGKSCSPRWFGYQAMSFLNGIHKRRRTIRLLMQAEESNNSGKDDIEVSAGLTPEISFMEMDNSIDTSSAGKTVHINRIRKGKLKDELMPENTPSMIPEVHDIRTSNKNEWELFGETVACELQLISSEIERQIIKREIQRVIHEGRMKDIEQRQEADRSINKNNQLNGFYYNSLE